MKIRRLNGSRISVKYPRVLERSPSLVEVEARKSDIVYSSEAGDEEEVESKSARSIATGAYLLSSAHKGVKTLRAE